MQKKNILWLLLQGSLVSLETTREIAKKECCRLVWLQDQHNKWIYGQQHVVDMYISVYMYLCTVRFSFGQFWDEKLADIIAKKKIRLRTVCAPPYKLYTSSESTTSHGSRTSSGVARCWTNLQSRLCLDSAIDSAQMWTATARTPISKAFTNQCRQLSNW